MIFSHELIDIDCMDANQNISTAFTEFVKNVLRIQ